MYLPIESQFQTCFNYLIRILRVITYQQHHCYSKLVADPCVARDYFLRWSHYYYYYFVIWTNLMKSNAFLCQKKKKNNAFLNHIYHNIIFYYCRIVLFKIWNLNSTIVDWLIFTSLSQLNTFFMLHVNLFFHKGWNNVCNIFFL